MNLLFGQHCYILIPNVKDEWETWEKLSLSKKSSNTKTFAKLWICAIATFIWESGKTFTLKCIPGGCAFGPLSKRLRIYNFFNFSFTIDGLKGKWSGSQGFLDKLGKLGLPLAAGPRQALITQGALRSRAASSTAGRAARPTHATLAADTHGITAMGASCSRPNSRLSLRKMADSGGGESEGGWEAAWRPRCSVPPHSGPASPMSDKPRMFTPAVASTFSACLTPICALPALAS